MRLSIDQRHRPAVGRVLAAFSPIVVYEALVQIVGDAGVELPPPAAYDVKIPHTDT